MQFTVRKTWVARKRLLQGEQLDAVLLDVQLGNEDGLSLAAWMRQQPRFSGIPSSR